MRHQTYLPRAIESVLSRVSDSFPVVLVTGQRQVGKTTLLRRLSAPDRRYVTLDDPMVRELAKADPGLFVRKYVPPILIDEIQYAPELLPYIKMRVDEERIPGAYWITGSQMFSVMKGVSESLAGRVGIFSLLPFSRSEVVGRESIPFTGEATVLERMRRGAAPRAYADLFDDIFRGGMPYMHDKSAERNTFFSSYVSTYIQRDIRELRQVGDERAFYAFLTSVAARTGQLLNYADLSKELGISAPTVKQWLSVLVSSGIIYLLEPYYANIQKRLVKSPKLYFIDTGLCAYLTRWSDGLTLEAGSMSGAFFETWVVSEVLKSWHNAGNPPRLAFLRDSNGTEIDLLIQVNDVWHPIEIKKSSRPDRNAVKAFSVLDTLGLKRGTGGIVCFCDEAIPLSDTDSCIPVDWI